MGQTFSTLQRDVTRGNIFSAVRSQDRSLRPGDAPVAFAAPPVAFAAPPAPPAAGPVRFPLSTLEFPPNLLTLPGGFASDAHGTVILSPTAISAQLDGLKAHLFPGGTLNLWLVRDLAVPPELPPADVAAIATPQANQPGTLFTWDAQPPTVGRSDLPGWNTLAIACPAGRLELQATGSAVLESPWQPTQTLDPRAAVGVAGIPATLIPSGLAAQILTATYMQPATVLPHVPLANLPARLEAVAAHILGAADTDRDGQVSAADLEQISHAFLPHAGFNRVVITLEPPGTAGLQPSFGQSIAMGLLR